MSPRRLFLPVLATTLGVLVFATAPALAAAPETPELRVESITATTASFYGVLNPNAPGVAGTYQFFYKASKTGACEGESHAPASPGISLGALHEELPAEPVSGLKANTEYAVCLLAENPPTEKTLSAPVTFTTAPEAPETLSPAKSITATTAVLEGILNPKAAAAVNAGWYFDYSTEAKCTENPLTSPAESEALLEKQTESKEVTELQPNKKYEFCLVAFNAAGAQSTPGNEVPFETKPAPPTLEAETESAAPVTATEETLHATINPNNERTKYSFEYSTSEAEVLAAKGTKVAGGGELENYGGQGVEVSTGAVLHSDTKYFYRVIAENEQSEIEVKPVIGTVEHFTTQLETPETLPATLLTSSAATLNGVLSPNATAPGEAGTYEFAYRQSLSECQGEGGKTAVPAGVAHGGKEAVSVSLTGLPPDATYTYCLLERSAGGETARGAAVTFTTRGAGISEEYVSEVEASAAILHAKIDPNESNTTYHFEYDTSPYTSSAPHGTSLPSVVIPAGTSPVPVSVPLQSLQPGATYYYRVVAVSELSPTEFETFDGPDKTFTTPAEPSTAADTCPNAQARAEQPYGKALPDCRAYEMVSPLEKNGTGISFTVSRASVGNEASGPEASAITYLSRGSFSDPRSAAQESRYLSRRGPDGWSTQNISVPLTLVDTSNSRAFEELLFTPSLSKGVTLSKYYPLVEDEPAGYINLYVADLTSSPVSYQTVTNVTPLHLGTSEPVEPYSQTPETVYTPEAEGVSTDLSHVAFESGANLTTGATGEEENKKHVYEWEAETGKLSQVDISPAGTSFEGLDSVGAPGISGGGNTWHAVSASGLRVFFTAGSEGTNAAQGYVGQLYVRENPEQPQSPVNGNDECEVSTDACTVEVSKSQRTDCNVQRKKEEPLYVCTGASEEDHNGPQPAYYRDANVEGTRVFFTSRAELTNDANTGDPAGCSLVVSKEPLNNSPNGDCTANLYEYDLETKQLTDLTVNAEPDGAAVLGLVTAGENIGEENSYVYFVANGVLASNENAGKETAQPGTCKQEEEEGLSGENTCNLYVAHYNDGTWETKFIAKLAGGDRSGTNDYGDEPDWVDFEGGHLEDDFGSVGHTARVTPDGATLAFESERSLTGYDNEPAQPGGSEAGNPYATHDCTESGSELKLSSNPRLNNAAVPCREVYLYHAGSGGAGSLTCASCDPSGVRPVGPAELGGHEVEGGLYGERGQFYLARNLSKDGGRLFFQSPDALVPHASDGKLNVYEWESEGEGTCRQAGGCVFPISDVAGDGESHFMDASPNGENVFINTADQLVPADTDTREDVYDVRVGGGFPVTAPPPVCDNGDSCKPPVSAQPSVFGPAGSATFDGIGNFPAAVVPPPSKKATVKVVKCKKNFVKKKVKKKQTCVKKKKSKKSAAKKSSKGRK